MAASAGPPAVKVAVLQLAVVELDLEAARAAKHGYPVLIDRADWA